MSRFIRLSVAFALVAGLAATAAFLMPAGTKTATAQGPDLGSLEDGLFNASTICNSGQIEIHCSIDSDSCGRPWSATGCCEKDEVACCELIPSPSNPTCSAGFAITCN